MVVDFNISYMSTRHKTTGQGTQEVAHVLLPHLHGKSAISNQESCIRAVLPTVLLLLKCDHTDGKTDPTNT